MAQYEASEEQLKALVGEDSGLSKQTQDAVLALIGTGAAVAATEASQSGTDNFNVGLVSQKGGTEFNDATYTKVQTAVFDEGAKGEVNLTNNDGITTEIVKADGLEVNMGSGDNSVTIDGGQASVNTGDGEDTFNIQGAFKGDLNSGGGDDEFVLDTDAQNNAEVSVDAGDGFDLMRLIGKAIQHQFEFSGGKFHMKSANITLDGVDVVATDENNDGKYEHITVLANDNQDSLAAKLYMVAFGREAIDDGKDPYDKGNTLAGIKFWMDQDARDDFGQAFLNCDEFHNKYDKVDNKAYVNSLFENLGLNNADLQSELLTKLENGQLDRYEVAITLAESDQAVKLLGNDGIKYVIDSDNVDFSA